MEFYCIACDFISRMTYAGQRLCSRCMDECISSTKNDIDAAERARKATVAWSYHTVNKKG